MLTAALFDTLHSQMPEHRGHRGAHDPRVQPAQSARAQQGPVYLFIISLFIYLFLAALGLCCCARAFSSCGDWGLLFAAVRGFLIEVASLVAEHGL